MLKTLIRDWFYRKDQRNGNRKDNGGGHIGENQYISSP